MECLPAAWDKIRWHNRHHPSSRTEHPAGGRKVEENYCHPSSVRGNKGWEMGHYWKCNYRAEQKIGRREIKEIRKLCFIKSNTQLGEWSVTSAKVSDPSNCNIILLSFRVLSLDYIRFILKTIYYIQYKVNGSLFPMTRSYPSNYM